MFLKDCEVQKAEPFRDFDVPGIFKFNEAEFLR